MLVILNSILNVNGLITLVTTLILCWIL